MLQKSLFMVLTMGLECLRYERDLIQEKISANKKSCTAIEEINSFQVFGTQ